MTGRLRFLRSFSGAFGATIVVGRARVRDLRPLPRAPRPGAPIGVPLSDASGKAWLGTDFLGRDVFSRLLYGGRSVILIALAATVLAYAIGLADRAGRGLQPLGRRSAPDAHVDVMLAFPPLLFLLVLITGAGTGVGVLIVGVALIQAPAISRIVRTATLRSSRPRLRGGRRGARGASARDLLARDHAEHPRARRSSTRACASRSRS